MPTSPVRRPKLDIPVFAQRDGNVRLGWHPERSFLVAAPPGVESEVLLELLRRLDGVHSRAHMIWYAGTVGLSANSMSTLLSELDESGLLTEGGDPSAPRPASSTSKVTVVHVLGRGPIADAVVSGAVPSSTLVVHRSTSTRRQTAERESSQCHVVLLTDDMVPDPRVVTSLVRTRTPHLQVRLRDGRAAIGPFVLPGVSSCLRCADLVRCDLDPQWPHISAQLLGRVGHASKPTVLAAAAVALAQVEAFIDGRRVPLADMTLEVDLRDHTMTRRTWGRHPLCDCTH
ncbi:hypothetical protein QMK17_18045 [Rhodococcus sp. G-MC3]|uniref:hypothetical protein n=1 Tax=Rhodococcus sp. G-MC3 TaxID=3046209 RepID=UPI0024BA94D8|nr:hypothetical protein [Rhodococcus sp. G-MC3]MDJ0395232.1 hypothetical protein [Rhodococcus sp. G-MC3]